MKVTKAELHRFELQSGPATSTLSGLHIRSLIESKGWPIQAAARYLGVSRQRLYQVFAQTEPVSLWECVARGLPEATPQLLRTAKARAANRSCRRSAAAAPAGARVGQRITTAGGYTVGDVLAATTYIGEIADEGDEGVLEEIARSGNSWVFRVRFQRGEDVFPETHVIDCMAPTGKTVEIGNE